MLLDKLDFLGLPELFYPRFLPTCFAPARESLAVGNFNRSSRSGVFRDGCLPVMLRDPSPDIRRDSGVEARIGTSQDVDEVGLTHCDQGRIIPIPCDPVGNRIRGLRSGFPVAISPAALQGVLCDPRNTHPNPRSPRYPSRSRISPSG